MYFIGINHLEARFVYPLTPWRGIKLKKLDWVKEVGEVKNVKNKNLHFRPGAEKWKALPDGDLTILTFLTTLTILTYFNLSDLLPLINVKSKSRR